MLSHEPILTQNDTTRACGVGSKLHGAKSTSTFFGHPPPLRLRSATLVTALIFPVVAFGMGVALVFSIFPSEMLLDRWAWWGRTTGDAAMNTIGYLSFAHDAWRWPITMTTLLNPPGANVFYADAVPAAALMGKLIYTISGTLPLYLGRWIVLGYGMQAYVSWLLFRQIGLRPAAALVPAFLILLTPAFLWRSGGHYALMAHWLILSAILFYLRAVKVAGRGELYAEAVAMGSVLAVNPYLLAMSAPVFLAGVAEAARRKRIPWSTAMTITGVTITVVMTWAFVFGLVGQGRDLPLGGGFGIYSMNLASPFIPQLSSIPGFDRIVDYTGGQLEGFNYLGCGVLLLVVGMVVLRSKTVKAVIVRHPVLVILLVGYTLYAASSKLYIGSWHIGDIEYEKLPGLHTVTQVFIGSGRFFWPVGYVIVVTMVAVIWSTFALRIALLGISTAVLIQWIDIAPLTASKRAATQPDLIDRPSFTDAAATHDGFRIYPALHCVPESDYGKVSQLQLIAVGAGILVSGARLNRGLPSCLDLEDDMAQSMTAAPSTSNPLVILFDRVTAAQLSLTQAASGFGCRDNLGLVVCSRRTKDPSFVAFGNPFEPQLPLLPLNKELSLGIGGDGSAFLGTGWTPSRLDAAVGASDYRWAEGARTYLLGRLDKPLCSSLIVSAALSPLSRDQYAVDRARVTVNGDYVGDITLTERIWDTVRYRIPLGGHCLTDIALGLQFSDLQSPKQLGINEDDRKVSWAFRWFSIAGE